jgi:predicted SnoaL-like aldol condensation-catalyzing enzyme
LELAFSLRKINMDNQIFKNEQIALLWFAAFNEHNLEKLLTLYDDNAKHYSPKLKIRQPETEGWIVGKDALRTWWADAFERLPTLHYKLNKLTANHERVFMEYTRQVEGEEDMLVAEVLEIEERIVESRVYHG